jgi:hypothetical protein
LDELLDLEVRIRRKLAQAAASIGVESEVIPDSATGGYGPDEHAFIADPG